MEHVTIAGVVRQSGPARFIQLYTVLIVATAGVAQEIVIG
jgi:hypothetical protein